MIKMPQQITPNMFKGDTKITKYKLDRSDAKLKKVCNSFEDFFVQQLLDISLKNSDIGGKGSGSDIIKGLFTQGVADSSNGAFGISEILYKHLSEKTK